MDYKILRYKVKDQDKMITICQWENGFYFIPKLYRKWSPQENCFYSIEEIEMILGIKLEFEEEISS